MTQLPSDLDLTGRVVLVTGGTGAIGVAIAERFAAVGAQVALASRKPGPEDSFPSYELDVRSSDACSRVVAAVAGDLGRLDVLVNNAGVMVRHGPVETTDEDWDRVLDTNLTGAFRMARAAYEHLANAPDGAVVNVTSTHAHLAARGSTAYSVSKAGLNHLTRLLALEWAESGIRVNAVAPTVVPSAMTAAVLSDPAYIERKFSAIPLGRAVSPEEVAAAVVFAASPAAGSFTGQVIVLDGGESLP